MPVAVAVRTGHPDEADALAGLLAQAYHPLPVARWLIPDAAERGRCLPVYLAIFVNHAMKSGHVHVAASRRTDRPVGVALWLDRQNPVPDGYTTHLTSAVPVPQLDRFRILDTLLRPRQPPSGGDHLAFIGVRPTVQRRGIGGMLLRHHHRWLDGTGATGSVHALTPRTRDWFLSHGYQPYGDPVTLPPNGPAICPLWCEPPRPGF